MELIFNPEGKDELEISYVEDVKKALGSKQTSSYLFMMVCDSLEEKGKIESVELKEGQEEPIFDFEEA